MSHENRQRLAMGISAARIGAMVLRHLYVLRGSWPRLLELAYWPTMQMIIWGFITVFLYTNSTWVARAFGVLLSAVMLWDVLFRGQLGFTLSFMEEMWSRNLANLFVSPLKPIEHVLSLITMSLIRTIIGVLPAALLAIPLYHYSIFSLGLPLLGFFANLLVMSWAMGLPITALILRFGQGAENFAWFLIFLLAPVSAVYYPVHVLPSWLQPVSWSLPSTYVFEGMRSLLVDKQFRGDLMLEAAGLNLVYIAIGIVIYLGGLPHGPAPWAADAAGRIGSATPFERSYVGIRPLTALARAPQVMRPAASAGRRARTRALSCATSDAAMAAIAAPMLADNRLIVQKSSKPVKLRCTVISRVSIPSSPAIRHSSRSASVREAPGLGGIATSTPRACISALIGSSGKPPPRISQA